MVFNLNELATDFRFAVIEELSLKEVDRFLKEVQNVYSILNRDDQIASEELWVGFDGGDMVINSYWEDNFYPLINIKDFLTKRRKQVKKLYIQLCCECYANKISFC